MDPISVFSMPTINFTDRSIRALKTDLEREDYWDSGLPGFVARVYSSSRKNYEVIYRTESGRRARIKVGDAKLVSLADAKKKAKQILVQVGKGEDPAKRKQTLRAARTFAELSDRYLETHCIPNLRPRSVQDIEYTLRSELLPAWGHLKVHDISRADIIAVIESIGVKRNAPVRANHVRAVITGIFSFAIQRGVIEVSPCVGLPRKYREVSRSHFLSDKEIIQLRRATALEEPVMRDLIRVLLLLGQRSGETRQMKWEQIEAGVWRIPASVTKNKHEHLVPLPLSVQKILKAHRDNDSEYVFPSRQGGPLKWIQKANYRIHENMPKANPWTIHDLRRTCATGMEQLGISDSVITAVLNHTKTAKIGVTGRYARHKFLDEKGDALQKWVEYVESLGIEKVRRVAA